MEGTKGEDTEGESKKETDNIKRRQKEQVVGWRMHRMEEGAERRTDENEN